MAARGSFVKYWVVGLVVVFALQGVISYFLFSAQTKKLRQVREKSDYITDFAEEKMAVIKEGADRFEDLVGLVNRASDTLDDMVVVKTGPAADEMMVAVAEASNPLNVKIIEIVPLPAPDDTVLASDNWRLRASGRYPDVIRFIGKMERQGLVIDANNFALRSNQERRVELTAVIKICTLDRLERAAEEIAAGERAGGGRGTSASRNR